MTTTAQEDSNAKSFVALLAELLFGDERLESLDQTLTRLVSPSFKQRINGTVYHRDGYLSHVRDMRATVVSGQVATLEEVHAGKRIAGRYLFQVTQADGSPARYEAHIFAEFADDERISRMCEVTRVVEDGDDDLLPVGQ